MYVSAGGKGARQSVPVFQHGGSWGGQRSDFFFVPDRQFAMTVLTNSTSGPKLLAELGRSGWALGKFCGLSNPPADPKPQPAARLKEYEGRYTGWVIQPDGPPDKIAELHAELKAIDGSLRVTGELESSLTFYRDEYVLAVDRDNQVTRSDFLRGPDGKVAWLRDGGRLWAKQG